MRGFIAIAALAIASSAFAQMPPQPHGQLIVFGSTIDTVLKAPALSGRPRFDNSGQYWGLMAEIRSGKLSLAGRYTTGANNTLPGGTIQGAPTFNPLSGEQRDIIDVVAGYRVLENPVIGTLDVTAGYLRVWALPLVSPANWYDGPQFGFKGRREFANGMAVSYKAGYVPTYTVKGYVHKSLAQDDILVVRAEGEVPVYKKFFVTGGYEHLRFEAVATDDRSSAVIVLSGFFAGAGYRF